MFHSHVTSLPFIRYQLGRLPTEMVINRFRNELITQNKMLYRELIIFDSNKLSVINSFGGIRIGELHRRRNWNRRPSSSAKLESANFIVDEIGIGELHRRRNWNRRTSSSKFGENRNYRFARNGPGRLYVLDRIMDRFWYRGILKQNLLPSIEKLDLQNKCVFMHDNDPKHTSSLIKD